MLDDFPIFAKPVMLGEFLKSAPKRVFAKNWSASWSATALDKSHIKKGLTNSAHLLFSYKIWFVQFVASYYTNNLS